MPGGRKLYSVWRPASSPVPAAPTLGQTIKEGFGYGVGSAVAHRVVGAVVGSPTVTVKQAPSFTSETTLTTSHDLWTRCLEQTKYDTEKCAPFKPSDKKE